jgi:uncharacterized protein (TIGR01777 family)
MKIFITGGTGFVGQALVDHLLEAGHQITILSRGGVADQAGNPRHCKGDPSRPGPWQEELSDHEAVINLAGASIFCRWNQANRRAIHNSRVLTTRNIVAALPRPGSQVRVLLNGSAVGFYGNRGDEELTEESAGGNGFLAEICTAWEAEAERAEAMGIRVLRCRLGVVLGSNGGALSKMVPMFRTGLGAQLGNGRQWFPWIHLTDLLRIFDLLLNTPAIAGAVNCVAPETVTNRDLTRSLAQTMGRPQLMLPVPAFVLKIVQGEASDLLLDSAKVHPGVLTRAGFIYKFPTLAGALSDLVAKP